MSTTQADSRTKLVSIGKISENYHKHEHQSDKKPSSSNNYRVSTNNIQRKQLTIRAKNDGFITHYSEKTNAKSIL